MAGYTQHVAVSVLVLHLLLSAGCSSMKVALNSMIQRGAAAEELVEKKVEYRADLHEQRMAQKLAELDDRLRMLNHTGCSQTETTLAMEMSQSLEIQDITVDIGELKNVIARAEARLRAEQLRRQRLPGLLREQHDAFHPDGFGRVDRPQQFEQVAYDNNLLQASDEADIVVGIDQHGDPLPFCDELQSACAPALGPSEIPYIVRMKIHVGLQNPRLEKSEVRRHPGCGLPDCHGKGCSACARANQFDAQQFLSGARRTESSSGDNYMQVVQGWPSDIAATQLRSGQQTAPATGNAGIARRPLAARAPPTNSPRYRSDRSPRSAFPDRNNTPEFATPAADFWHRQAAVSGVPNEPRRGELSPPMHWEIR